LSGSSGGEDSSNTLIIVLSVVGSLLAIVLLIVLLKNKCISAENGDPTYTSSQPTKKPVDEQVDVRRRNLSVQQEDPV